jgi:hypothetical protein
MVKVTRFDRPFINGKTRSRWQRSPLRTWSMKDNAIYNAKVSGWPRPTEEACLSRIVRFARRQIGRWAATWLCSASSASTWPMISAAGTRNSDSVKTACQARRPSRAPPQRVPSSRSEGYSPIVPAYQMLAQSKPGFRFYRSRDSQIKRSRDASTR